MQSVTVYCRAYENKCSTKPWVQQIWMKTLLYYITVFSGSVIPNKQH